MTRARETLTLCEQTTGRHPFARSMDGLTLRARPPVPPASAELRARIWQADPGHVVLSWPGHFAESAPIHCHLAALDVGDPLALRPRHDNRPGWELVDTHGVVVTRMSLKFQPPAGTLTRVSVAAILVRHAREQEPNVQVGRWEFVLPEIEYLPSAQ